MAEQLKHVYNPDFIENLSQNLAKLHPSFDQKKFMADVLNKSWEQKELKQRMRHISQTMGIYLPSSYKEAISIIVLLSKELKKAQKGEMSFKYMILPDFVEVYGLKHFELSIKAMEEITQLSSAEFAVRPFMLANLQQMINQFLAWSKHKHAMVRRLASEGSRPRLPWGMGVPALKNDPSPILPILENLKNDPSETVRRSVANNLNDISKDHPQLVIDLIKKWKGNGLKLDKLVKHAARTLLKKADPEVMKIFGVAPATNIAIQGFNLGATTLKIGEDLYFEFSLISTNPKPVLLRVEYAIYYLKANGTQSQKKFKITENTYQNGVLVSFKRKQSFRNMTTRKHYAGLHRIGILINGIEMTNIEFTVLE